MHLRWCNKSYVVQVPVHYDSTHKKYTLQGGRVIALARRSLGKQITVRDVAREDAERDLQFCGFVVCGQSSLILNSHVSATYFYLSHALYEVVALYEASRTHFWV